MFRSTVPNDLKEEFSKGLERLDGLEGLERLD